ncbi:MAG: TMEM165/GDT1 family protein [Endomicrobiia bacterium]
MNTFFTAFWTIFLAELGDKTQLAIISLTTAKHKPLNIWLGATIAFCILNLIAVTAGGLLTKFLPEEYLKYASGTFFIIIGLWTIFSK